HLSQELRLGEGRVARIDHDVVLVINDALELTGAHVEHEAEPRGHACVEPDVGDGHREFDVTHPFTTHPRERHLNAAPITYHAFVLDPLVFSAGTFPVPRRTENAFAEQASFFRLEGPVVNRFGVFE